MSNTNYENNLFNDLFVLKSIVDYGNFSTTSRKLGINVSTISKQISRLENQLGVKLFERNTHKIQITDEGWAIYEHSKQMLELVENIKITAEQHSNNIMGKLVVSAPKAFAREMLSTLMPKFLAQYPKVCLQLKVTDQPIDLINDSIDIAIVVKEHPSKDCIAKPLMKIEQVICASPSYLSQFTTPLTPKDLLHHTGICLGENPNDNVWKFRDNKGNIEKIAMTTKFATNHSKIRLQAIIDGVGIGHTPYFVAQQALQNGDVIRLLPDWDLISNYQGTAWLTYLPNKFATPKVKCFVDFLTKEFDFK